MKKKNNKRDSVKGEEKSVKLEVLTPTEHMIYELVRWLMLGDNTYTASGWHHFDTAIKAKMSESNPLNLSEKPSICGLEDSVKKSMKDVKEKPDIRGYEVPGKLKNINPGEAIEINGQVVTIYRPLLVSTIKRKYFEQRDWNTHEHRSLTHQRFLHAMYTLVQDNFECFLFVLGYAKSNVELPDLEYIKGGLACLPELIDRLQRPVTRKYRGIGIPDLYTYEEGNLYMSHDLADIQNIYRADSKKQLYAYSFSRDTASQFSALLSELFIRKHEEFKNKYYGSQATSMHEARWIKRTDMPNATRGMMKQADMLFDLRTSVIKDPKNAKYKNIEDGLQLLFFEKLKEGKEFTSKVSKSQWIIAQGIMTGQSACALYNRLKQGASKDLRRTFQLKTVNTVDKNGIQIKYDKFRKRILASLDTIQAEIQSIKPDEIV